MNSYESLFCFNLLPLPKKLVPRTTNAKNIWRADWRFLLASTGGLGCGGAVVEVFASPPSAPSPAGWMACPWMTTVHGPGPWRITSPFPVLARSQSGWERQWKAERETKENWFFSPVKFLSFGFLPLFLKLCSFAKSDEFIVFLRLRTELVTPSADLGLSESEPDAQIKSASCPEQWLLEATGWFICSSWSFLSC